MRGQEESTHSDAQIVDDVTRVDDAAQEVENRVQTVIPRLPATAEQPTVQKLDTDEQRAIRAFVSDYADRQRYATKEEMAAALQVSAAYLSALEHGHRGRPSAGLVHQVNEFFGLIWDEAEELARLARDSHPRPTLDASGLSPEATALANRLAREFRSLTPGQIVRIAAVLDEG